MKYHSHSGPNKHGMCKLMLLSLCLCAAFGAVLAQDEGNVGSEGSPYTIANGDDEGLVKYDGSEDNTMVCDADWTGAAFDGHCYKIVKDLLLTWQEASDRCKDEKSELITVELDESIPFLMNMIASINYLPNCSEDSQYLCGQWCCFWLNAQPDEYDRTLWYWGDDETNTIGVLEWGDREPDNMNDPENCLVMSPNYSLRMCDRQCNETHVAVCRKPGVYEEGDTTQKCNAIIDLVFLLDKTVSIGDDEWKTEKQFIANVTQQFQIGPKATQVALAVFAAENVTKSVCFNTHKTETDVIKAVNSLECENCRNGYVESELSLGNALIFAKDKLVNTSQCGRRPNAPALVFVITDGWESEVGWPLEGHTKLLDGAINNLKAIGATVIAVGVGRDVGEYQLKQLASSKAYAFMADDFSALLPLLKIMTTSVCNAVQNITVTPTKKHRSGATAGLFYTTCYPECDASLYIGTLSVTQSGKGCQNWYDHTPHEHDYGLIGHHQHQNRSENSSEPMTYGDLMPHNYCRDLPYERRNYTWCLTTDPNTRVERCNVPTCEYSSCYPECQPHLYRGTVAVTRSGRKCQAWSAQTPHKHEIGKVAKDFVDGTLPNNYCRVTRSHQWEDTSDRHEPWCYTQEKKKRWEKCDVPRCVDYILSSLASGAAPLTFVTSLVTWAVVLAVMAVC